MSFGLINSLLNDVLELSDRYSKSNSEVRTEYYKNGRVHGKVTYADGRPDEYFIEGRLTTKEGWEAYLAKEEDSRLHYLYVDGVPYRVSGKQLKEIKKLL